MVTGEIPHSDSVRSIPQTRNERKKMANMSYVRFSNTLADLKDCYANMDEDLSAEEAKARQRLVEICRKIVDDYGDEQ